MAFQDNAFPMTKDGTNISSGTFTGSLSRVFWCRSDGDLTVTYQDDTTKTVSLVTNDAVNFIDAKTIEVVSGSYFVS